MVGLLLILQPHAGQEKQRTGSGTDRLHVKVAHWNFSLLLSRLQDV